MHRNLALVVLYVQFTKSEAAVRNQIMLEELQEAGPTGAFGTLLASKSSRQRSLGASQRRRDGGYLDDEELEQEEEDETSRVRGGHGNNAWGRCAAKCCVFQHAANPCAHGDGLWRILHTPCMPFAFVRHCHIPNSARLICCCTPNSQKELQHRQGAAALPSFAVLPEQPATSSRWAWLQHQLHRAARSRWLRWLSMGLIVFNTVIMCINWYQMPHGLERALVHVNQGLAVYFTLELAVRLTGIGPRRWGGPQRVCLGGMRGAVMRVGGLALEVSGARPSRTAAEHEMESRWGDG